MQIRFTTKTIHAHLNYPVALSLLALAFIFDVCIGKPWTRQISAATGVATFIPTLLIGRVTGIVRVALCQLHVAIDRRLVGAVVLLVVSTFGFRSLDMSRYLANTLVVLFMPEVLGASGSRIDSVSLAHA